MGDYKWWSGKGGNSFWCLWRFSQNKKSHGQNGSRHLCLILKYRKTTFLEFLWELLSLKMSLKNSEYSRVKISDSTNFGFDNWSTFFLIGSALPIISCWYHFRDKFFEKTVLTNWFSTQKFIFSLFDSKLYFETKNVQINFYEQVMIEFLLRSENWALFWYLKIFCK